MKNINPKYVIALYFNSWWFPAVVFVITLAAFMATAIPNWRPSDIFVIAIFACLWIAFLGIIVAAVWNLIKKRWIKGAVNLIMLPVCAVMVFIVFFLLSVASMSGPSEDHLADNLKIPDNISVSQPKEWLQAKPNEGGDIFQSALLKALKAPGGDDPSITADVASLISLQRKNPAILKRYLETSPAWRVFKERNAIFATRRWMIGPEWRYNLHGYYTKYDLDPWTEGGIPDFQFQFTIGLSGKPWVQGTTRIKAGDTAKVNLTQRNRMYESRCVITAGDLAVEIFEQSEAKERRLTKAALDQLNQELRPLIDEPDWAAIQTSMPGGSIRRGEPSFDLRNSFQPGIYDSEILVNSGESGMIYLKAFEVTKGTPLSAHRLKEESGEWIGWSNDPKELFLSNTHFTIYEGDWGKPYAARFEVWFVPDSGGHERKLIDKVLKIEGWQR